jgi:hypothetical protein
VSPAPSAPAEPGRAPEAPRPEAQRPEAAQPPQAAPDLSAERSGATAGEQVAVATTNVIGDLLIPQRPVSVSSQFGNASSIQQANTAALISRGAFKITENESPRPQDRVFLFYNYFNNVGGQFKGPGVGQLDVHRETAGFEKTFLNGEASIGMRLPYLQFDGGPDSTDLGDLSIIGKFTLLDDRDSGLFLSSGLVVTAPTGGVDFLTASRGTFHPTLLQPYVGYIWGQDRFFVQGFNSLVVPLDDRDVTIFFSDIALGYTAYRSDCGGGLSSVTPVFEVHVTTPLNHRGSEAFPLGVADIVDLTLGTHFVLNRHAVLTLGVCTPVTGPQPFDVEGIVQFNYRF